MPKFFVSSNQVEGNTVNIYGTDVDHIKKVLRKNINDEIIVCNKDIEQDYLCRILKIEDNIECEIVNEINENTESNVLVTIYQGLPKFDKMELVIQKSVELGVYEIIPLELNRCVVKLKEKDRDKKIQRWQKISEVAAKQCGRNYIPNIGNVQNLKQICEDFNKYDLVLVAYENEKENTLKPQLDILKNKNDLKIAVIIGPEGGIDEREIEEVRNNGAKVITLGKRILRTETVALNVLSIIMYELEN